MEGIRNSSKMPQRWGGVERFSPPHGTALDRKKVFPRSRCFRDGKKKASQPQIGGGNTFQAQGPTGAKALGQEHSLNRPPWLENSSRVENAGKQSWREASRAPFGAWQGAWLLFSIKQEVPQRFKKGEFTLSDLFLPVLWGVHCRGARMEVGVPLWSSQQAGAVAWVGTKTVGDGEKQVD